MKRLLIVITRMYARQGDDKDEFVKIWKGPANTEHRIFRRQTGSRDDNVLVLHGYDYPQHVEAAISRVRAQIEVAIRSPDLRSRVRERRTGVMFHPRLSWTPVAQMQIADGIKICLRKAGAAVDYVEAYHHGSIVDRKLAQACLGPEDFSSLLDELWRLFLTSAVARYKRQLDRLTKELKGVLSPISKEFETWRRTNFDHVAGLKTLRDIEQTARGALIRARQLVIDEPEESYSVATLTWEVAEKVDEKKKEKLISTLAELENLFSQNDCRYQRAESLLQSCVYDPTHARNETNATWRLDTLHAKLVESDPLDMWYQAVVNALSDLGKTLNE